jgi:hypothetical protein
MVSNFRRYYGPAARIRQQGIRKGVFGGNRAWLVVWIVLTGTTALKRKITRQPQFVSLDTLQPGQRVTIRTIPVQSAKERKQLLRGQN